MAFKKTAPEPMPAYEVLTARMIGIGLGFAAELERAANQGDPRRRRVQGRLSTKSRRALMTRASQLREPAPSSPP
jgi:hypothetical protein